MKKILVLLLAVFSFCSCSGPKQDKRPVLTVSIEPLRFVVEAIVGDKYQVQTLMPQGVSPETYDPTPRQMAELSNSEILFCAGTISFEQVKIPQLASSIPHLSIVNMGEHVATITDHHHKHGDEAESIDPHIWMSPQNLKMMAQDVCHYMCFTHPTDSVYYEERLSKFEKRMDQLDHSLRSTLQVLRTRSFLIYHPALGYFSKQYGLNQLSVEFDGKDPSAAYFQQLINLCKVQQVSTVFISKEHNGKAAQRIATEINAQTYTINPLDYNVEKQLLTIAKILKQ